MEIENNRNSVLSDFAPQIQNMVRDFVLGLDSCSLGRLPRISGVYFAVDDTDCVQYVGCSIDIAQRWRGHHLRGVALASKWRIFFKEVDYKTFRSKESEEAFFIATLRPKYNNSIKCTF